MSFKCYHIKTFKEVDSSNNYCLDIDIYVGNNFVEKRSLEQPMAVLWSVTTEKHWQPNILNPE